MPLILIPTIPAPGTVPDAPAGVKDFGQEIIGGYTVNQLLTYAMIYKILKMPGGQKVVIELGKKFLDGMFSTLKSLGQASAANKIAAWANPLLISAVLDRFGFVDPQFIGNYHLGLTMLAGVQVTEDFVSVIANALPWNFLAKAEDRDYPTHITFSDPDTTITTTAPRMSLEEIREALGKK